MSSFEEDIASTQKWFDSPRFKGIVRLYTARQVVEQRGSAEADQTFDQNSKSEPHGQRYPALANQR